MNDKDLDLLDLDDADDSVDDTLPDATPFVAPRPHHPWLLLIIGLAIIVLAVFIIIRVVGNNSSSSMDVDLGAPVVVEEKVDVTAPAPQPTEQPKEQPKEQPAEQPAPQPVLVPVPVAPMPVVAEPAPQPAPVQPNVRVIEDRKDVKFNPSSETVAPKPIPVSAPKQAKTPTKPKPAPKPAAQKVANGGWYVQFGSYGTRDAAAAAEKKIRAGHSALFSDKKFVILAAVLPNGTTTYRLRVAFATSGEANGFCRNAKSDGLDCYVAK